MLKMALGEDGIVMHRAGDVPIAQFQVLGERGTGTNVVRKTLERHLKIMRVEGLGWKHAYPHMVAIPRNLVVVCVVRNATDWVRSLYQRPWHCDPVLHPLGFSDFLRAEWHGIIDRAEDFEELSAEFDAVGAELQFDRNPLTGLPFENVFRMRSVKLGGLATIPNRGCSYTLLRFESFAADPEGFTRRFAEAYGLDRALDGFQPVKERLGNRYNRSGALPEDPPQEMSAEDRAFMLSQLDLEQEAALGYSY